MTKEKRAEQAKAIEHLREMLKRGDTIYTVLRGVSSSGMSRRIDVYVIRDNQPMFLSGWAADVLGWSQDRKRGGIRVSGCGMDMGFHLVYELSSILFHGQDQAGYALQQRWL